MTSKYICALTFIRIITQDTFQRRGRWWDRSRKPENSLKENLKVRIDSERFHLQNINLGFMCRWRGLLRFSQISLLSDLLIILSSELTFMCVWLDKTVLAQQHQNWNYFGELKWQWLVQEWEHSSSADVLSFVLSVVDVIECTYILS